ncbi:MAG: DEAD/DEAH box helicase [Acidobacteriota bacterium]
MTSSRSTTSRPANSRNHRSRGQGSRPQGSQKQGPQKLGPQKQGAHKPTEQAGSFHDLGLHPKLLRALDDLDFDQPTPIQRDSVPPAIRRRDVLACAATGSGKTAAFLLPILQRLIDEPTRGMTRALVLTPTRELAAQIVEHFEKLAKYTKLRAAAVYGGVGMQPQVQAFKTGADLIVACPGRLLDHFQYDYAHLDELDILVLDEVDRMLDMGFLRDVRRVLKHLDDDYEQALFFSATLPKQIVELAHELLEDPVTLSVERKSKPAEGITQALWPVREDLKKQLLLALLERDRLDDVLVFTRTKHRANRLADFLVKRGISADRIHGNRSQAQRTKALASFKAGKTRVLVATDIAARGIDVTELSHVVNFDVPNVAEDYIHRVGRTARAGATGDAFTFVTPADEQNVRAIERAVGQKIARRTLDGFDYQANAGEKLEIPLRERLAKHRAQRQKGQQKRAAKNAQTGQASGERPQGGRSGQGNRSGQGGQKQGQGTGKPRRRRGRGRGRGRGPAGPGSATATNR